MKNNRKTLFRLIVMAVTILFIGVLVVSTAQATPLEQDPRPPAEPGDGGNGGGNGGGGNGGGDGNGGGGGGQVGNGGNAATGSGASQCAAVNGEVLNWGFGPEANIGLKLSTGSWNASASSASDGQYGMGGLGVGIASLQVLLAPGQTENLQPWIQDAAVYLTCDFPTVANIAVYSGLAIDPPASIEIFAPDTLTADSQTPLRLTVNNDLPNEITNVIVTDLMPPGLVALDVQAASADMQNVRIIDGGDDGQLVVVYMDSLPAGAEANIFITVAAAADVPAGTQISNTATLFYRESVADQAQIDFTIGRDGGVAPGVLTESAIQTEAVPPAEAQAAPQPETGEEAAAPSTEDAGEEAFVPPPESAPTTGEELVPPSLMPTTGDEALPPPALLPETGLGLLAPLTGVGLVGLAFLAHLLRVSRRPKE